jgi:hypothetical protein
MVLNIRTAEAKRLSREGIDAPGGQKIKTVKVIFSLYFLADVEKYNLRFSVRRRCA